MAKSTAEEVADILPVFKRMKSNGLLPMLWRRNRGYLNRKTTSLLFDILEILSLALLSDIESLKYFYIIWIIFYFSQNILESLFYSARKIFVHQKNFPTKRTLGYIHILVLIIPFFFIMVSFEKLSQNNIAFTYLLYKSTVLMMQTIFNYMNFEVQTLSRVYYPPSLNWILLGGSLCLILLVQNVSHPLLAFFAILAIFLIIKLVQDMIMLKKGQNLKSTILWQLKRKRITDVSTVFEFLTLISIEAFLPLSILTRSHESINVKTMSQIFLIYMIVKLFMRPIRSLILDLWTLGVANTRRLILATFILADLTAFIFYQLYPSSQIPILIGFMYFLFLMLWNTDLLKNKFLLIPVVLTLISTHFGVHTVLLLFINTTIFIYCFIMKYRLPKNLQLNHRFKTFDDKYIITFKTMPRWSTLANRNPDLLWSPVSKKRCVLESFKHQDADIQKFIMNNSYDIKTVQKMNLELAKKLNIT